MEQPAVYNSVNFSFAVGISNAGTQYGVQPGFLQTTALSTSVTSYSALPTRGGPRTRPGTIRTAPTPPAPTGPTAGPGTPSTITPARAISRPNGAFSRDFIYRVADITDGTSGTMFVGETSRFLNDPETFFGFWNRVTSFNGRVFPTTNRPQGLGLATPRPNANLLVPDPPKILPIEAWLDPTSRPWPSRRASSGSGASTPAGSTSSSATAR